MDIANLTHVGTGDLTADVIDFETTTNMDKITFDMDGVSYLTDVKTDVVMNILMEFTDKSSKFTLKENQFKLNALDFSVDGFYEMFEGYDDMDLKLNASKASFKDFLSLIPAFYHTGYESMVSKGNLQMGGFVKGKMDDKNMPGWDFKLGIDKASIRYPDLPGSITNIAVKAVSKFAGGEDMDKMTIDVDKFHALFGGNSIDANLKMRNPMTDPLLVSNIMAKMDLATLKNFVPMAEGESYNGKLDADVHLDGRMSALEREDYEAFKAEGLLTLKNMLYQSKDLSNDVAIDEMIFRFSPKNLALEKLIEKNQINLIDNLIDKLRADGLIVHVNPMQEWLQPEGDRFKNPPLETLKRLIDLRPNLNIIVKEVGQGMGPESLSAVLKLPIMALDFAAAGGTSFSMLELLRSEKTYMEAYKPLASIGHRAEEMVGFVNQILKEENDILCKEVIISGGIQSFVDGYYLTNKINTSSIYGQASAFLKHARGNYDDLQRFISLEVNGLELAKRFFRVR
jgi:hypothetical protein